MHKCIASWITRRYPSSMRSSTPGVFLEQLAKGPATEDELMGFAQDIDQSTGNRKLKALGELGLVEQDPGKPKAPDDVGAPHSLIRPRRCSSPPWISATRSQNAIGRPEPAPVPTLRNRSPRHDRHPPAGSARGPHLPWETGLEMRRSSRC